MPLLAVEELSASYEPRRSGSRVLDGVSLSVDAGEVVALLGANGAGKTTTLRVVSGLLRPETGRVLVDGTDLAGAGPRQLVRAGVALVPAGRRLFGRMTVRENLDLAGWPARPAPADVARVHGLFPVLADRAGQEAGTLSGGEQQMLAVARALVARPRILLLDEASEGLAPDLVVRLLDTLATIAADGCAVLLVEQNASAALRAASRGYVLETGRVVLEGSASALSADPRLAAAYLGG